MKTRVICIGRLKERFWEDAVSEYKKRLSKFTELEITELPDEKPPHDPSPAEIEAVREAECARILDKLSGSEYVIALDPRGKQLASEELASKLQSVMLEGKSRIAFIIGGSYGLTEEVRRRADLVLSFSKMTFSHRIFRAMLLEQVYRAFKINAGEPYHK